MTLSWGEIPQDGSLKTIEAIYKGRQIGNSGTMSRVIEAVIKNSQACRSQVERAYAVGLTTDDITDAMLYGLKSNRSIHDAISSAVDRKLENTHSWGESIMSNFFDGYTSTAASGEPIIPSTSTGPNKIWELANEATKFKADLIKKTYGHEIRTEEQKLFQEIVRAIIPELQTNQDTTFELQPGDFTYDAPGDFDIVVRGLPQQTIDSGMQTFVVLGFDSLVVRGIKKEIMMDSKTAKSIWSWSPTGRAYVPTGYDYETSDNTSSGISWPYPGAIKYNSGSVVVTTEDNPTDVQETTMEDLGYENGEKYLVLVSDRQGLWQTEFRGRLYIDNRLAGWLETEQGRLSFDADELKPMQKRRINDSIVRCMVYNGADDDGRVEFFIRPSLIAVEGRICDF